MKRPVLLLAFLGALVIAQAQTTATFENFGLSPGAYLNGSDGSGGFASGHVFLPNTYDAQFQFWDGWAISSDTDTQTPGFLNEFSAITGSGHEGSTTYAVTYCGFGGSTIVLTEDAAGAPVEGLWITNSTYAYLSMRDGDAFSKRFGGITGNDPDYFLLTVKKYLGGSLSSDSIDFYLADYRFADSAQDYIVDEWTWLDLSALGNADSLLFTLNSTDVGQFGMNTPAYFCIDNLVTAGGPSAVQERLHRPELHAFPNPAGEQIAVRWTGKEGTPLLLTDAWGRTVRIVTLRQGDTLIDLSALPSGMYYLRDAAGVRAPKAILKK